jgi:hypothetical protein
MKNFIERMKEERTPHERRQFAMRVAATVTAVLFVGWLATFGVRISTSGEIAEQNVNTASQSASVGGVVESPSGNSTLYVSTTSVLE